MDGPEARMMGPIFGMIHVRFGPNHFTNQDDRLKICLRFLAKCWFCILVSSWLHNSNFRAARSYHPAIILGGAIQSIFQPWRPATQTHIWINFVFHIILKRRAAYPKLWQLHLICIRSMPHQRRAAATNTFPRGGARQKIQHAFLLWKICPSFPTICRLLYSAQDDRQSKHGVGGWR